MGDSPQTPYPPDTTAEPKTEGPLADTTDLVIEGAELANQRAPGVRLTRVELRGCRLTGAELADAQLTDVTFTACRLDLAGLRFAKLQRVAFVDCRLEDCDLYGASLCDVLFEHSQLTRVRMSDVTIERVELSGCDLTGLEGAAALRGARIPWSDVVAHAGVFAGALGIEIVD
jgi:uncharacterized protein YjbI with pentapeptide repeats